MAAPPFREALITGASSGLGRAIAVELGRRGAHVHLIARREDELERARMERELDRFARRHTLDETQLQLAERPTPRTRRVWP